MVSNGCGPLPCGPPPQLLHQLPLPASTPLLHPQDVVTIASVPTETLSVRSLASTVAVPGISGGQVSPWASTRCVAPLAPTTVVLQMLPCIPACRATPPDTALLVCDHQQQAELHGPSKARNWLEVATDTHMASLTATSNDTKAQAPLPATPTDAEVQAPLGAALASGEAQAPLAATSASGEAQAPPLAAAATTTEAEAPLVPTSDANYTQAQTPMAAALLVSEAQQALAAEGEQPQWAAAMATDELVLSFEVLTDPRTGK